MNIQIRSDSVVIDGYVNVVERESKPLGVANKFIETIKQGAFNKSLKRRSSVMVLFNHDVKKVLACTTDGTATLREDPVGLYCSAVVTDVDVIEKAKAGKLSGWSFGFKSLSEKVEKDDAEIEHRNVYELDLIEVSILDDTKNPAYPACCIATRDDGEEIQIRAIDNDVVVYDDKNVSGADDSGFTDKCNNEYKNRLLRAKVKKQEVN